MGSDFRKIVSIEGDIESADGNFDTANAAHGERDAFGEGNAAAADSDKGEVARAAAGLNNLVSQTLQSSIDFRRRHELRFFHDAHARNASTSRND